MKIHSLHLCHCFTVNIIFIRYFSFIIFRKKEYQIFGYCEIKFAYVSYKNKSYILNYVRYSFTGTIQLVSKHVIHRLFFCLEDMLKYYYYCFLRCTTCDKQNHFHLHIHSTILYLFQAGCIFFGVRILCRRLDSYIWAKIIGID